LITTDEVDAKIAVPENKIGSIFPKQEAVIEATALGGSVLKGKSKPKAFPLTPSHIPTK
jgi:hypothetical protein